MKWFLTLLAAAGLVCLWRGKHTPYRHPLATRCRLCGHVVDLGSVQPYREKTMGR